MTGPRQEKIRIRMEAYDHELLDQSARVQGDRDVAKMLARSFDLEETDIQVLQWHQLH